jgi:multidrug efflux pump subunit AcrB
MRELLEALTHVFTFIINSLIAFWVTVFAIGAIGLSVAIVFWIYKFMGKRF